MLPSRLALPQATRGAVPFDDDARFFEPWWPGAHVFVRAIGGRIEIQAEHLSDPLLAFPELQGLRQNIDADGVIVEGTLLALDAAGRPDARLLRQRLAQPYLQDITAEGAFVASDMPYLEGRALAGRPFAERRHQLAAVLHASSRCVLGPGLVGEGVTMGHAVAALGLDGISARRLDARWKGGPTGDAWLHLPVTETPAQPTRPFLVLLERLPLEG